MVSNAHHEFNVGEGAFFLDAQRIHALKVHNSDLFYLKENFLYEVREGERNYPGKKRRFPMSNTVLN